MQGDLQAVIEKNRRILREREDADAYNELAVALRLQEKLPAALAAYRRSLALKPGNPVVLSNMGGTLRALGRLEEAAAALRESVRLDANEQSWFNLGLIYKDMGQVREALACFANVLKLNPGRADAKLDYARVLLQAGKLQEGFALYEHRFEFEQQLRQRFRQPFWDGAPLGGKTLLLYCEQGMGDTLQLIRYVPLIDKQGGRIIVVCQLPLRKVIATCPGIDQLMTPGEKLPPFDVHLSLFSLPFAFKTALDTIPAPKKYLSVPPDAKPPDLQAPEGITLKVGIAWGTGHANIGLSERAIPLAFFLNFLQVPGVRLYSLQKGEQAQDISALGCEALVQDLAGRFEDFADTAAAMGGLDLIIASDTGLVHLAGALGKPVWVLLPYASEWRWLLEREDTPWYPSMRLFRQKTPGDWQAQFDTVTRELRALVLSKALTPEEAEQRLRG